MPLTRPLAVRDFLRVLRGFSIRPGIVLFDDRPEVRRRFLPALCVPCSMIRPPFGDRRIEPHPASARADHVDVAVLIDLLVSVEADAAGFDGVATHSGTSANVSTFAGFRSRIGGMMSATFNPVSASIVSATASNSAQASRCGSVSKSMLLLSMT